MSGPTAIPGSLASPWPLEPRCVEAACPAPERLPERPRDEFIPCDEAPVPPAAAPPARKAYAVDPLGGPLPALDDPLPRQETVRAVNWFEVTNLGTLLDVLA